MSKISPGYSATTYTVSTLGGARCCGTVGRFIVAAPASSAYDVRWCAIDDPTDWPTPNTDDARSKQAGQQPLSPEHGWVTAIAGNDFYGYVFQERAITKMTYVGGDVVFAFDTFEEDRGCERTGMMVAVDDMVFFKSDRGYHVVQDGQVTDIGYGKVDDTY